MDDKQLEEILQEYASSTRSDREVAFKKLNEQPVEAKPRKKKLKPQIAFSVAVCSIILVLCIALPLTLAETPRPDYPAYCATEDILYKSEEDISVFINDYDLNAWYPSQNPDEMFLLYSSTDSLFQGVQFNYIIIEETMEIVNLTIIPKTYVLQLYEEYYDLSSIMQWRDYQLRFEVLYDEIACLCETQIYFRVDKYDYFLTVTSDEEIDILALMNTLYI